MCHNIAEPRCVSGDRNATATAKLEDSLVTQLSERSEHGVLIDAHDGGEVASRGQSLTRFRLSLGDLPPELSSHL